MSSDEFYGPALPPGFTKVTSDTPGVELLPEISRDRKRRHSSSSDSSSSSSSSRGSDRSNGDRRRLSEKEECKSSERLFGPALPEGFSPAGGAPSTASSFIGPVIPPTATSGATSPVCADDDDDDDVGPSPALNTDTKTESTIEQIESRAKLMKDKLEGKDPASLVKKREEWMTELPPEMTKNFGVTARKFSTKTTTSVDKDRSAWTDTPVDRARKEQEVLEGKAPKAVVEEEQKVSAADQLNREQVDEYNRLARPKSLLEMHEDKTEHKSHHKKKKKKKSKDDRDKRKKKKSKKKESKEEKKPERQPFDRDKDLAISRMDDAQRKSVISRSKELGGRFGHGTTQFL